MPPGAGPAKAEKALAGRRQGPGRPRRQSAAAIGCPDRRQAVRVPVLMGATLSACSIAIQRPAMLRLHRGIDPAALGPMLLAGLCGIPAGSTAAPSRARP